MIGVVDHLFPKGLLLAQTSGGGRSSAAPSGSRAPAGGDAGNAGLDGSYSFSGGDSERRRLAHAMDASVAGLNVIARTVARHRLRSRVIVEPSLAYKRVGSDMEYTVGGQTVRTPLSGAPIAAVNPAGDSMKMRQWFEGKNLVQVFELEFGVRRNELALATSGSELTMKVEITSSQLSGPVRYQLTYRRQGK